MRKEQEDHFDPAKPALLLLYGATKRKCRPLTGEMTVVGRGPGCDIGLVSPEVAPVHCVIVRLSYGWRIRDCSGRATRVNGRSIDEEPLNNGDVIQIGTFSFEANLPPLAASPNGVIVSASSSALARLQASRRRLVERGLHLRRRLRDAEERADDLARREHDLALLEQRLRTASQNRPAEKKPAEQKPDPAIQANWAKLEARKTELDHFARHLRRLDQKVRDQEKQRTCQFEADRASYEADLVAVRVELDRERLELADLRQQLELRHVELEQTAALLAEELSGEKEQLENERGQIVAERVHLDQQRQDLLRFREDLERRGDLRTTPPATRETLCETSAERLASARKLLNQLAERRKSLNQTTTPIPSGAKEV